MFNKFFPVVALAAMFALDSSAQMSTRRANITGARGDTGKCTIEVRVDGAADIEINGESGRIRNLNGQPASWVRFECSEPIPRNPSDFRFRGIDGRGNVQLVRDPQSNRGVAVVRIVDSKGGSEGYTFDLEWRGGSDYRSGRDYGRSDGRYEDDYRRDRGYGRDGYNRDRDRTNIVTCASMDGRRTYCEADTRGGVTLLRQQGGRSCREGSTWGYDRRGIWVDRGCQADFEVRR